MLLTDTLVHTCIRQFDQLCLLFEDKERETKFNVSHLAIHEVYDLFKDWAGNIIRSTSPREASKNIDILKIIYQALMALICEESNDSLPVGIEARLWLIADIINQDNADIGSDRDIAKHDGSDIAGNSSPLQPDSRSIAVVSIHR